MNTIEKLKAIVNNEKVGNCFFNLYDRWRDESEYEDINQYGDVIIKTINKQYPQYGATLVASTNRPFGVKIDLDGQKFQIQIKLKGCYVVLSVKKC